MSDLSSILPEPPDGTMVVLLGWENRTLVWRSDVTAAQYAEHSDERWFSENTWFDGDPLGWDEITRDATTAYLVQTEPVAKVAP